MRDACGPSAPGEANPAVSLGAFLAAEIEGLDRPVFFSTDSLKPVARRIGYLVGASTGKNGRGIVPIFGRPSYGLEMLQQGCFAAILKMAGEEDRELGGRHDELRGAGVPMVTVELNGPEELAVELFKWEITTALDCSQLAVGPLHDPDIRESRSRTVQILEQVATKRQSPAPATRVREGVCPRRNTLADLGTEYDRGTAYLFWLAASARLYRVAALSELWGGPQNSVPPDS